MMHPIQSSDMQQDQDRGKTVLRPLVELLEGVAYESVGSGSIEHVQVGSITADSRNVIPLTLFAAIPGSTRDGHEFIGAAIEAGAVVIVAQHDNIVLPDVDKQGPAIIRVADSQKALGQIAARFYGSPAEQLTMIGITGTNGKTTVSYLLEQALLEVGLLVGVIGTIDYRYRDRSGRLVRLEAPFTTPDPVRFHSVLRAMVDNGVTHLVMEVSSHALEQKRLGPVLYDIGIFTNLSQDHLDYHGTMESYFAAKGLLFSDHMVPGSTAIIMQPGSDQPEQQHWAENAAALCSSRKLQTVICGPIEAARFMPLQASCSLSGLELRFRDYSGKEHLIQSALIGGFNIDNLLVSLATLDVLGIDPDRASNSLSKAHGAPGRLEKVVLAEKPGGQPTVLVDYAHTPDALEKALTAVAGLDHETLICVVGCGGDRDRSKRPLMGRIAAGISDVLIVTDDNPRSEEPEAIRKDILAGIDLDGGILHPSDWLQEREPAETGVVEINGRGRAIQAAISAAGPADIVLIAGKGHEKYQLTSAGKRFFDDCLAAQQASLQWDTRTVVEATGGRLAAGTNGRRYGTVVTDSRRVTGGDIFVALKGDTFDGHDFIGQVRQNGAGCIISSEEINNDSYITDVVRVEDTERALGDLAAWRRRAVRKLQNPLVVGLTGSSGKTTVKEMTAAIFMQNWPDRSDRPAGRVLKTDGNFNNLIGLPLTLMPVSAHHRGLVIEMGMNRPGEISRLTEITDPDIACINNVHGAHLEGVGTIEGVARAKAELFERTREHAIHVVNCDDELVLRHAAKYRNHTVGFGVTGQGMKHGPDVWAEDIVPDESGHLAFILHVGEQWAEVKIHAPGLHNAANACAAAAIGYAAGIDFNTIADGLQSFRSTANRMESLQTPGGLNVLNDTYNANPASMGSALQTLARLPARMRVAILGDMLELGETGPQLHEQIGRLAAELGIDSLYLVGNFAAHTRAGAISGGLAAEQVILSEDKNRSIDWIKELQHSGQLQSGDWILVKASRGLALETVVQQLLDNS